MSKNNHEVTLAVKEHLLAGNPLTQLEANVLFGATSLWQRISDMRKEGWVIKTQRVSYAKALRRINEYASLAPPKNLPIKEIQFTEYWVNR